MPNAADSVASLVALLFVAGIEVERLAVLCPLQRPVFPLHVGPTLPHLSAALGKIWRPLLAAGVVASRRAPTVFVEDVYRHAILSGEHGRRACR
jgi:hypothetical protein